ncbi:MAG TPA: DUF116 domain-containing protein [Methanotrichaceae archaeon]|nr:DUF116 domain-containing protein [Methanotrichaceae archaeon]
MLPPFMDTLFYFMGEAVFVLAAAVLISAVLGAALIAYSFKTGHFFMARIMLIFVCFLESLIKSIFRTCRADDAIVDEVGIRLRNYINAEKFEAVPMDERAIFLPQCVRSVDCPAKLTPEGLRCVNCGRCEVGTAKVFAEGLGYRFFVAPGSSLIKRMIKKYRPRAIVGVGCNMEIKEGVDLCHGHAIPAIGVPLLTNGCVSTTLDWDRFYKVISDDQSCTRVDEEEKEELTISIDENGPGRT